jgi:hypothetical protein
MKKAISSVLLLCVMALCSTSVLAADACEVVLCMYGKATEMAAAVNVIPLNGHSLIS